MLINIISCTARFTFLVMASILVLLFNKAQGQNAIIDSLKKELDNISENNIQKADILHQLAFETWDINFDEALRWAQEANTLSNNINYRKGIVQSLTDIGQYYYNTTDYPIARRFYSQALEAAGSENFGDYPAYTLIRLGNLYRVQSSFDSAKYFYQRAQTFLANEKDAHVSLSSIYYNLGALHADLSEYDMAKDNMRKSLEIRLMMGDSIQIAECWSFLGGLMTRTYELDSAEYYLKKSYRIAETANNSMLKLHYFNRYGELAYRLGDYTKSIEFYSHAIEFMKKNNYRRYYPEILKWIGQIFRIQGDFNRALENYLTALEMSEQMNNKLEISRINNLIGWLYINEENDSLAMEFGQRSLQLARQLNDNAGIASGYNLLGYIYLHEKNFDQSVKLLSQALRLREELPLNNEVSSTLFNLAQLYNNQGLYENAVAYHKKILKQDLRKVDKRLQVMVFNSLGSIYLKQRKTRPAREYLLKAEELALRLDLPIQLKDNKKLLAEYYKQLGDYRNSSRYLEEYVTLNDSLYKQDMLTKVIQLSALYQLSKKEKEIRTLSEENELKQSQINLQGASLKRQRNILTFSIIVLILLLVVLYVVSMYYRAKKRSHDELKELNHEISEMNEEIQAQSEELMEANSSLSTLNNDLIESREEIQAQSEELIEANQIIANINRDLEEKVLERTAQLEKAYIELDTFFYRSSHDFRRPLTTFLGLSEVAKITVRDKNALELFDKVRETALNLDKMLVKLQSISEVGTQQLYYEEADLKDIILNTVGIFRSDLELRNIKLILNFESDQKVYTYPVLVKILIENLVENAVNFSTQQHPFISIRTFKEGKGVGIEIKDNGQGFAPEFSEKIFDMYFRANYMSKGNGLGLYIVKKAVDKLSGTITFSTVQFEGSTFSVILPIQPYAKYIS